ncbi:MAG: cytochrome c [Pseudomonadota bacterium]
MKPQTVLPCTAALASIQSASRTALLLVVLSLAACGEGGGKLATGPAAATPAVATTAPARVTDAGQLARGAEIYQANCAACHGPNAEGAPNWHQKGADGKFPPPPLDASGHGWHHPKSALVQTVKEGTVKLGGGMPAWRDKLTETDIEAVIAWIQSRWPEDVYKSWALIDEKARRGLVRH